VRNNTKPSINWNMSGKIAGTLDLFA